MDYSRKSSQSLKKGIHCLSALEHSLAVGREVKADSGLLFTDIVVDDYLVDAEFGEDGHVSARSLYTAGVVVEH